MNETPLSPERSTKIRQQAGNIVRTRRLKESLLAWSIALVTITIEAFLFNGYFASTLVPYLPHKVIYYIEYGLVVYIMSVVIFMGVSLTFGAPSIMDYVLPTGFSFAQQQQQQQDSRQHCLDDTLATPRLDKSWIEDIHFGTPSEKSFINSNSSFRSPPRNTSLNKSEIFMGIMPSSVTKSVSHAKPVDSIHTREQLERYLKKEAETSFLDVSSASLANNSFTYFNMLDLSGGERKPYQISETVNSESKDNTSILRLPTDNRVHLTPLGAPENDNEALSQLRTALLAAKEPKKTTGSPMLRRAESVLDRRRRSSHSSPTPQLGGGHSLNLSDSEAGGTIEAVDLAKAEHKLRSWIVKSILSPLRDQIKKVNVNLEKEHANPPLRIGISSVEALKSALAVREPLRTSFLPFVLPYLACHTNQAYLVSRISELSADPFMLLYNWNSGGSEPEEKNISTMNRNSRRRWHEGLPTDAELIFHLFSTFMDYQLTSNPLVGSSALDQPFAALYTLKAPHKPTPAHCAPGSFYLHMSTTTPPHFDFIYVTEGGRIPMKTNLTKGSANLFHAILQFVHHAKTQNAGKIDMVSIGYTGLGISSIFD